MRLLLVRGPAQVFASWGLAAARCRVVAAGNRNTHPSLTRCFRPQKWKWTIRVDKGGGVPGITLQASAAAVVVPQLEGMLVVGLQCPWHARHGCCAGWQRTQARGWSDTPTYSDPTCAFAAGLAGEPGGGHSIRSPPSLLHTSHRPPPAVGCGRTGWRQGSLGCPAAAAAGAGRDTGGSRSAAAERRQASLPPSAAADAHGRPNASPGGQGLLSLAAP